MKQLSTLVIASHNAGKVREIGDLLAPFHIQVKSAGELNLPEPEETGDSFVANAELKAVAAAKACGLPCLADDSGLAVPALGGAPGIYSARWAGEAKDFTMAMKRVEQEIAAKGQAPTGAAAYFVCALALALPDGNTHLFEGEVHGTLQFPPVGEKGFGYDPIFMPEGHAVTFAQMEPVAKHAISHRARAFAKLVAWMDAQQKESAA